MALLTTPFPTPLSTLDFFKLLVCLLHHDAITWDYDIYHYRLLVLLVNYHIIRLISQPHLIGLDQAPGERF